ncbi:PA2779 family protein [Ramlibacter rhizophilus]|uniref:PA2779 family protein n=1 Tax=Ramlibacter rhizophilus TaxID=1781167 RepID=A0A4Z0BZY5_9BURK|nr:PA2779 family protein [Ramlibacter rhizophilus]TFZ04823.1 hypothetical protein EZ242_03470 [Ramlibacter rhizophilus]
MTAAGLRNTSRGVVAVLALALSAQMPLAQAGIVDTDALATPSQAELDRAKVQAFMDRANVKERMQAMGLSGVVAGDRVASLSEAEVHALAQRIDTVPAGGQLTTQDWILVLLGVLLIIAVL